MRTQSSFLATLTLATLSLATLSAHAETTEVSTTGKGVVGGTLIGAEVVLTAEAAFKVQPTWAYVVGGLGGGAAGGIGGAALHAQTAATPAYLIGHVQITDQDGWKQYIAALPATLAPYHVKTLSRAAPVALDA